MRMRITVSFLLMASLLIIESCADSRTETGGEQRTLSVCELGVTRAVSDGELVTVKGKIGGYHELFLHGECNAENDRFVELEFSEEQREGLMKRSATSRRGTADVSGEATITGRFYRDGGKLYTYPRRQVEPGQMLKPVVVDKVTDATIIAFQPD